MKHIFRILSVALIAGSMMLVSCEKENNNDNNNTPTQGNNSNNNNNNPNNPNPPASTIAQGRIGNGSYVDYNGNTQSGYYGFDVNNDGVLEFSLTTGYDYETYEPIEKGCINFVESTGSNVWTMGEASGWDWAKNLAVGTTVNENGGYYAYGDATIPTASIGYVGLRVKLADGIHYAWARYSWDGTAATWTSLYYNTTVGAAITVGQTE